MTILMTALALAAAQAAPAAPADHSQHDQHRQHQDGGKHAAHECCCKMMASDKPMACCADHGAKAGDGKASEHEGHSR